MWNADVASFKFASRHNTGRASLHHRAFEDAPVRRSDGARSRRSDSLCPSTKGGSGFVPASPIVRLIGGTGSKSSGTQEPQWQGDSGQWAGLREY